MKIGFFGTPDFAAQILADLLAEKDMEVLYAVTQEDKPTGRKQTLTKTPVKVLAEAHGICVFTPQKLRKNAELLDGLRKREADYLVVAAYGKILPKEVLALPKKIPVNVHGSVLPKYRGASPIQAALLAGEAETGVTIMEMSEGMDEGDILDILPIAINGRETAQTLFEKFARESGAFLAQTLRKYDAGKITPQKQNHAQATYCGKIEKEDGRIDWTKTAAEIYHAWQAHTPWPGAYTFYGREKLRIDDCEPFYGNCACQKPGSVFLTGNGVAVTCGDGALVLKEVTLAGKKKTKTEDFLR